MLHFQHASTYTVIFRNPAFAKLGIPFPTLAHAVNTPIERLQHKYTSLATLLPAHTSLSGRRERNYAEEFKLVIAKKLGHG
jgi:hypothetical protein